VLARAPRAVVPLFIRAADCQLIRNDLAQGQRASYASWDSLLPPFSQVQMS